MPELNKTLIRFRRFANQAKVVLSLVLLALEINSLLL